MTKKALGKKINILSCIPVVMDYIIPTEGRNSQKVRPGRSNRIGAFLIVA